MMLISAGQFARSKRARASANGFELPHRLDPLPPIAGPLFNFTKSLSQSGKSP